jgi:hypothetical protein
MPVQTSQAFGVVRPSTLRTKEANMEWSDILIDSYNRVPEYLGSILGGLTPDDLKWQPGPDANSIGWLTWHLTRQHDAQLADLMGDEQLWVRDGWAKKFKRPVDGSDTGFGDTPEQVAAFDPPDNATILGYQKAVTEKTFRYIRSLSSTDLDRELGGPWTPTPTVGVRLVSILQDAVVHAGQAAYVRGLLQGRGWQSY